MRVSAPPKILALDHAEDSVDRSVETSIKGSVCEGIDACRDNHFAGRWIAGCDSLRTRIEADHSSHGEVGFELVTSWSSRCI